MLFLKTQNVVLEKVKFMNFLNLGVIFRIALPSVSIQRCFIYLYLRNHIASRQEITDNLKNKVHKPLVSLVTYIFNHDNNAVINVQVIYAQENN